MAETDQLTTRNNWAVVKADGLHKCLLSSFAVIYVPLIGAN